MLSIWDLSLFLSMLPQASNMVSGICCEYILSTLPSIVLKAELKPQNPLTSTDPRTHQ